MIEEISDHRLHAKLRKILLANPKHAKLCKSILYCGSKVVNMAGVIPAVFLLANEKSSKFFGTATCKNSWGCPVCSAKQMAKYASEIACAIDALEKWHNQKAIMITFTIPHTSGMSCEETTEILYNTWKSFIVRGNKIANVKYYANSENKFKHGQKKTLVKSSKKLRDPFAMFCEEFGCKHRVRVGEYTWGEHGWHPHFHCLFWVDADKIEHTTEWEDTLCRRWLEIAKRETIKYWDKKSVRAQFVVGNHNGKVGVGLGKAAEVPEAIRKDVDDIKKNNRIRADIMYSRLNDGSKAAYISKKEDGTVIIQKSSMYLCGWGADREITGNYKNKATNDGHLSPRQILELATLEPNDKYAKLYLEYLWATRIKRHTRINFSTRSGIKAIIAKWRLSNEYYEICKKKAMTNPNEGLKVVCWFKKLQWSQICWTESNDDMNIKAKILELARRGKSYVEEYLLSKGIDIRNNDKHHAEDQINKVFSTFKEQAAA